MKAKNKMARARIQSPRLISRLGAGFCSPDAAKRNPGQTCNMVRCRRNFAAGKIIFLTGTPSDCRSRISVGLAHPDFASLHLDYGCSVPMGETQPNSGQSMGPVARNVSDPVEIHVLYGPRCRDPISNLG